MTGTAAAPAHESPQPSPPVALAGRARLAAFATIALGMLLAALDGTIVSTALPTIVGDLGGGNHVSWVVTSYLLAQTATTVVVGKVGDQFGRKVVFQISVVVFIVGSALCGLSEGMAWLIGSRAVQGIGAGGLVVTATALIADIIPLRDRGKFQGSLGAVFGLATVLGPLLGGLFTDNLSWRWCFYVNVPLAALVILAASVTIPSIPRGTRHRIDYAGMVTVALGSSMLVLASSFGGTTYPWDSWQVIGLIVGGLVVLGLFVLVELRAAEPILPVRLFRSKVFADCCALSFVVGFTMLGALTFLPTFFQYVEGADATESGLRLLPLVIGLLLTATASGNVVSKTGHYKAFPVVGSLVMALGLFLLSRMDSSTSFTLASLYLFVLGLGIGLSMQVLTIIVQSSVPYADLGVATSGVTFFRTIGSAFGAAIFGSLYSNFLNRRLPEAIAQSPGVDPRQVTTPSALHTLPDDRIERIITAYADSLSLVFLWAVPVALVAFILALLLPQVRLVDSLAPEANDLGAGFGAPETLANAELLSSRIAHLIRAEGDEVLDLLQFDEPDLDAAGVWALVQTNGLVAAGHRVDVAGLARSRHLPPAVLEPAFRQARHAGYVTGDPDDVTLTQQGHAAVGRLRERLTAWVLTHLEDLGTESPEAVRAAISATVRRIVVERAEAPADSRSAALPAIPVGRHRR